MLVWISWKIFLWNENDLISYEKKYYGQRKEEVNKQISTD